tara:strand:- start:43 stop:618 length:576 start_codon:yes stop_codon:yes gene_type:complete
MKKIISILSIITLFFFTLVSCGTKTNFDKDDLKWLVYEQGDTLIFESETGTLDTTIILSKLTFYPDYNPIELHGKYHPQVGQIWYYNKNTPYINDGKELVYLAKNTPNQKADGFICYLNKYFFFDRDIFKNSDTTFNIDNKNFYDIIEITDSKEISLECKTIERIWWSQSEGIIKYETCNGIIWTLKINKI